MSDDMIKRAREKADLLTKAGQHTTAVILDQLCDEMEKERRLGHAPLCKVSGDYTEQCDCRPRLFAAGQTMRATLEAIQRHGVPKGDESGMAEMINVALSGWGTAIEDEQIKGYASPAVVREVLEILGAAIDIINTGRRDDAIDRVLMALEKLPDPDAEEAEVSPGYIVSESGKKLLEDLSESGCHMAWVSGPETQCWDVASSGHALEVEWCWGCRAVAVMRPVAVRNAAHESWKGQI